MASTTLTASATSSTFQRPPIPPIPKTPTAPRSLRRPSNTASTPNLNSAYSQSRLAPAVPLSRKTSLAALTQQQQQSSLASIPDVTESSHDFSILSERSSSCLNMAPATPGRSTGGEDIDVGDAVEVPGNLYGVVRFLGSVQGKKGTFAGVELNSDIAAKGKNSGDVDGYVFISALDFNH